jgi:hypothetical protein
VRAAGLMLGLGLLLGPLALAEPPKREARTQKPQQIHPTGAEDGRAMSAQQKAGEARLEVMTNRSGEGLKETRHANGMRSINLEGRFQHVLVAVPDATGKMKMVCTDDLAKLTQQAPALGEK